MSSDLTQPRRIEQTVTPKFGVLEYGFWFFLLIAIGRIGQLIPGLDSLPLGKVALAIPLVIRVVQRKSLPGLTSATRPIARTATFLAVLSGLLTFISIWPGQSIHFLLLELPVLAAIVSIAYVMARSWRTTRATLLVLMLAGAILARAALSTYSGGRAATLTMYDTNDLAYLLVTVFPLAIGFFLCSKRMASRIAYAGVAAALLIALLLTQSRGGLLALVASVVFMVVAPIRAPKNSTGNAERKSNSKVLVSLCVCGFGLIAWSYLPQDARTRLSTVVHLSHDYNLDPSDKTGRLEIWTRGLAASKARPIGYGPATFDMVDVKYGGKFNAPHNSFLEALVDLGVLGLILFVRVYFLAWRGLQRTRTRLVAKESLSKDQEEQVVFARLLQVSLLGNAVAGFFLSMTYSTILWTTLAICMAVMAIAEQGDRGPDISASRQEPRSQSVGSSPSRIAVGRRLHHS